MPSPIQRGTTIERYRVKGRLGSGSMGDVFLGVDIGLDREVAIKILSERHRENRELRARFVREAKAVAAIAHPNVVQVFATGTFDGRPYIAMEFLDGTDLGTSVEESGAWSSLQSTRAVLDAAKGLNAAAQAGLIHRDVKPSNLVLLRSGVVKVTDFGLAKPMEPGDQPALTALGVVVGTPDYIAPEQARGEKIDHRVDIYALGGTLYFLLTGMPPFRTGRPHDDKYLKVVARHLKNPAPDPCKRNPAVDRELSRLTRRLMAKKASDRPNYSQLIEQLTVLEKRVQRESGAVQALPRQSTGLGGQISPTPHVRDGRQPPARVGPANLDPANLDPANLDDDDAAPTKVHMPSVGVAPLPSPGPVEAALNAASKQSAAIKTYTAPASVSAQHSAASTADIEPAPGIPRWVWVVTVAAFLIFAVGGLLRLFGPLPSGPEKSTDGPPPKSGALDPASRSGAVTGTEVSVDVDGADPGTSATGPGDPVPVPEGMLLVPRADGSPWFLVDSRPVSNADYATMFPSHKSGRSGRRKAVTGVSYGYARSYAEAKGKRLLSAEEWQAASAVPGFDSQRGLAEWLSESAASDDADAAAKPIRSTKGVSTRSADGGKDVTFRLALDL